MYGMVNRAIEDLVCTNFGEEKWEQIRQKAGVEEEFFVSNEGYPDALTFRLVAAASEVLGLTPEAILIAFGEHWILKTAREGYGDLMQAHGRTLPEFLSNLPNFHTRVALLFPKLQPPRFEVSDSTPTSLHLHYHTHRRGLEAFVVGLLQGLGKMFETPVTVKQIGFRGADLDHAIFLVDWSAGPAAA